jgi:outer membrane protein
MTKAFFYVLVLLMAFQANAQITIGVIDLQKILATVKEGKDINDKLKKSFEEKKAILKKEEEKLKKEQEEFIKQAALLSNDAKVKKEVDLQQKISALQKKSMDYQKDISDQEASLKKPLLEKIKTIIEDISAKEGVDITVEISASPIVYAKNKKNLTDAIIKAYDSKKK